MRLPFFAGDGFTRRRGCFFGTGTALSMLLLRASDPLRCTTGAFGEEVADRSTLGFRRLAWADAALASIEPARMCSGTRLVLRTCVFVGVVAPSSTELALLTPRTCLGLPAAFFFAALLPLPPLAGTGLEVEGTGVEPSSRLVGEAGSSGGVSGLSGC